MGPKRKVTPAQVVWIAVFAYGLCLFMFWPPVSETSRESAYYERAPVVTGQGDTHARQQVSGTIAGMAPEMVGTGKGRHEVYRLRVMVGTVPPLAPYSCTMKPQQASILHTGASEGMELYLHEVTLVGGLPTLENPTLRYQEARNKFWMFFGFMTLFVGISALSCVFNR